MQAHSTSIDNSEDAAPAEFCTQVVQPFVRESLVSLSQMSDSALRAYIDYCGEHFFSAQRRYEKTGTFSAAGDRDACWCAEADALIELGNRPSAVARIKVEGALG